MGNQTSSAPGSSQRASSNREPSGSGHHAGPAQLVSLDGGFNVPMTGTYANQDAWEMEGTARAELDKLLAVAGRVPVRAAAPTAPGQEAEQVPLMTVDRSREPHAHREAEARAYERGTAECPICFLSYPQNINYSRCCDQPICTECFVHIKRVEPTPTNLTSEPVACPFCVEPEFGVIYRAPPAGMRSAADGNISSDSFVKQQSQVSDTNMPSAVTSSAPGGRRKSVSATAESVVTVDHIHPDWQAKLEAAKATAARRANRRIVFRRVDDRLIPVGITSSRDMLAAAAAAEAHAAGGGNSSVTGNEAAFRRSRRSRSGRDQDVQQYLTGLTGQDLEELMIMEAMRLSLLEQEEQQRKKKEAPLGSDAGVMTAAPLTGPSSSGTPSSAPIAPFGSALPNVGESAAAQPAMPAPLSAGAASVFADGTQGGTPHSSGHRPSVAGSETSELSTGRSERASIASSGASVASDGTRSYQRLEDSDEE